MNIRPAEAPAVSLPAQRLERLAAQPVQPPPAALAPVSTPTTFERARAGASGAVQKLLRPLRVSARSLVTALRARTQALLTRLKLFRQQRMPGRGPGLTAEVAPRVPLPDEAEIASGAGGGTTSALSNAPAAIRGSVRAPRSAPAGEAEPASAPIESIDHEIIRRAKESPAEFQPNVTAKRVNALTPAQAKQFQREALVQLFAMYDQPFERTFQDAALQELEQRFGSEAVAEARGAAARWVGVTTDDKRGGTGLWETHLAKSAVRDSTGLWETHLRKSAALLDILRLGLKAIPQDPVFLEKVVEELGRVGGPSALSSIERLQQKVYEHSGIGKACAVALAKIKRGDRPRVAQVALEGDFTGVGGIGTYVRDLTANLIKFGVDSETYLPLPSGAKYSEGVPLMDMLEEVPGCFVTPENTDLKDPAVGQPIAYTLYRLRGDAVDASGARKDVYFYKDNRFFGMRPTLYGKDDAWAADDGSRLHGAAQVAASAMSKVAAWRKLGRPAEATPEAIVAAEKSLVPSDVPDVIQYNDAHVGALLPMLKYDPVFRDTASQFVVHNLGNGYRPEVPRRYLEQTLRGLGGPFQALLDQSGDMLDLSDLMMMSGASINVVSKGYWARLVDKVKTTLGIAALRSASAQGLVTKVRNAIDLAKFDPTRIEGTAQPAAFSAEDFSGKKACKVAAQKLLGLTVDATAPMITFVGRFCDQKGIGQLLPFQRIPQEGRDEMGRKLPDLITFDKETPLDRLLRENPKLQLTMGGSVEDPAYLPVLEAFKARWEGSGRVHVAMGKVPARLYMSAADGFLMPSIEEPCGLTQMEAMRMGCAILAADRDGPVDTVDPYDHVLGTGEGFFCDPEDPSSLFDSLKRLAAWCAQSDDAKAQVRRNAMRHALDFCALDWALNMKAVYRESMEHHLRS